MAQDHRASKAMYYPCVSVPQKMAVDDDVPSLDVPSNSVDFDPGPLGNPVHFVDHRAFDTRFSPLPLSPMVPFFYIGAL